MRKTAQVLLFLLFTLMTTPRNLEGQATASGTILGTVTDPSQAVIPGAEVKITSTSTGAERTMMTGSAGTYRFDLLAAGTYKVAVASKGFTTLIQRSNSLHTWERSNGASSFSLPASPTLARHCTQNEMTVALPTEGR